MSDDPGTQAGNRARTKKVVLGGQEYDLKLTAGHVRYAQLKDVNVLEGSDRSNLEWGGHLVYVALLPELEDGTDEAVVQRWLMDSEGWRDICAFLVNQFFDASEAMEKSLAPRHQERIEKKREQAIQQVLSGLTST